MGIEHVDSMLWGWMAKFDTATWPFLKMTFDMRKIISDMTWGVSYIRHGTLQVLKGDMGHGDLSDR